MQHVEVERVFPAPPEKVWEIYTDHAGWKSWAGFPDSWLEKEGSPDRNGTGAVRAFGRGSMKACEEVLDFEPPRRMTYTVVSGMPMKDHLGEVVLEPCPEGTRLVWRCRFRSRVPGLGWAMRLFITSVFRRALDGLAAYAFRGEGGGRAAAAPRV